MSVPRRALLSALALACMLAPHGARAEDVKRACVAASTAGQTLRADEKLLEAREQMLLCARDACPAIVRSHCAKWLREVEDRIPSVVVRAESADGADLTDARLTIDGKPGKLDGHPVTLDPGAHEVIVETAAGARKEEKVLLADGEKSRLLVVQFPRVAGAVGAIAVPVVAPQPASARPAVPLGAWVLGGVGLIALGGFVYFEISARNDLDLLQRTCSPNCSDAQTQPGRTKQLEADVSLGVSIAAIGGAVLWTVLSHGGNANAASSAPRFELRPIAGGAFAGLSGSY